MRESFHFERTMWRSRLVCYMGSHLSNLALGGAKVSPDREAVVKLGQSFSVTAHLLQCIPFEQKGLEYVEESSMRHNN